jgi:hypothetical protein
VATEAVGATTRGAAPLADLCSRDPLDLDADPRLCPPVCPPEPCSALCTPWCLASHGSTRAVGGVCVGLDDR